MAITKLMHLKQGTKTMAAHLQNCIRYILNPDKTENGLWVGGNAGTEAREAFDSMIDTKKYWDKMDKRQGYHFVISFKPGEADEQTAYQVIRDFCERYLGDEYDYVFSIHDDHEHMHGHIVFNSVCRTDGHKYRYEKGDWVKYIQPVTDQICERYGLSKLVFEEGEKKRKSYAEHFAEKQGRWTWKLIAQRDIDFAIKKSESMEDFLRQMEKMGYRIKRWFSRKQQRDCFTFYIPREGNRYVARRDGSLGKGYRPSDIDARIKSREKEFAYPKMPKVKQVKWRKVSGGKKISRYQVRSLHRVYQARYYHSLSPYRISAGAVRKDLLDIHRLEEDCRYLLRNRIGSEKELDIRIRQISEQEKILKNTISVQIPRLEEEKEVQREYQKLKEKLADTPKGDDGFEKILDAMEELESIYPEYILEGGIQQNDGRLLAIREEKRIIRHIKQYPKNDDVLRIAKNPVLQKGPAVRR